MKLIIWNSVFIRHFREIQERTSPDIATVEVQDATVRVSTKTRA